MQKSSDCRDVTVLFFMCYSKQKVNEKLPKEKLRECAVLRLK